MKKIVILLLIAITLGGCSAKGFGEKVKFQQPDIKDDFCGVHINFQFCKCAFHNEYCEAIGMSKKEANTYVHAEYDKWIIQELAAFERTCFEQKGIFSGKECRYCDDGYHASNNQCISNDDTGTSFVPDGPLDQNCNIKPDEFNQDWKKYSDIDEAIAFEERSYEAKQAVTTYDQMINLMIEGFKLESEIELENQMQAELETYREALTQNIKTNLLKAFWRLSWITYSTVQSGKSAGESFSTLLTTGAEVETVGAGLKTIQSIIPSDSALAIDTSSLTGQAKSIGAATALEAIDSLGDPVKIVTEFVKGSATAPLPSADITQEEIDILKNQHLTKGLIDEALTASKQINTQRQARMAEIETEVNTLKQEIENWENQEKTRVQQSLEESCRNLKNQN